MNNIIISEKCGNFAENKDIAKYYRESIIRPRIKNNDVPITIDFNDIDSSTQSFIHALISDIFQKDGEKALEYFEFKNCNEAIKSLISTVINYSLE